MARSTTISANATAGGTARCRLPLSQALLLAPAMLLLALFAISVVQMVATSFTGRDGFTLALYQEFFSRPDYIEIVEGLRQ